MCRTLHVIYLKIQKNFADFFNGKKCQMSGWWLDEFYYKL